MIRRIALFVLFLLLAPVLIVAGMACGVVVCPVLTLKGVASRVPGWWAWRDPSQDTACPTTP